MGTATAPYDLGRTATHEVGHWLNLRHIWGDGGCSVDDFVADTPRADGWNFTSAPCTYPGPNSCGAGTDGDLPDMFQNYMDYSDDGCMNLFTLGQKDRMWAAIQASRPELLTAGCNQSPVAVCQNITVNTNDNCQGIATAADFDGGSIDPDDDVLMFSVSPAGPYPLGMTDVTLTVSDGQESDQCTATITLQDNVAPTALCQNVTLQLGEFGNGDFQVVMTDNGEPGTMDLIGLTLFDNGGGLRYASNWSGVQTVEQLLDGGNLVVHAGNGNGKTNLAIPGTATPAAITPDLTPELAVFPNPTTGRLELQLEQAWEGTALVEVLDGRGRLVLRRELPVATQAQTTLDLSGQAAGIYYVRISGPHGERLSRKVILTRR